MVANDVMRRVASLWLVPRNCRPLSGSCASLRPFFLRYYLEVANGPEVFSAAQKYAPPPPPRCPPGGGTFTATGGSMSTSTSIYIDCAPPPPAPPVLPPFSLGVGEGDFRQQCHVLSVSYQHYCMMTPPPYPTSLPTAGVFVTTVAYTPTVTTHTTPRAPPTPRAPRPCPPPHR